MSNGELEMIEEKVKRLISDHLGVKESEVKNDSKIVNDLGADSLDTIDLVMVIEEVFDILIPDELAEKVVTVDDAIDCINRLKS